MGIVKQLVKRDRKERWNAHSVKTKKDKTKMGSRKQEVSDIAAKNVELATLPNPSPRDMLFGMFSVVMTLEQ